MTAQPIEIQKPTLIAGCIYLLFVIYGSLVPLDFHPLSIETALHAFAHIPFLKLGIGSRADWVANILLYMPLSFLWQEIAQRGNSRLPKPFITMAVLALSLAISVAVEFTQLFFPPRTVSLNDLFAEALGSLLGLAGWHLLRGNAGKWLTEIGKSFQQKALIIYCLAMLILSLFPFDFVTGTAEFNAKLRLGYQDFFIVSSLCNNHLRCFLKLVLETLAVIPLGMLGMQLARQQRMHVGVGSMFFLGAAFGLLIELLQLFLYSGISQGISVITRSMGAGLGAIAYLYRKELKTITLAALRSRSQLRLFALLAVPIYLIALIGLQNWNLHLWLSADEAYQRLMATHFLPFYYHYFTSETAAVMSLFFIALSYAPIGFIYFLLNANTNAATRTALPAGIAAGLLASLIEAAKLFQQSQHADPTNVLIAACSSYLVYRMLVGVNERLFLSMTNTSDVAPIVEKIKPMPATSSSQDSLSGTGSHPDHRVEKSLSQNRISVISLLCFAALIAASFFYPSAQIWYLGMLAAYALGLYIFPKYWLVFVIAVLPILDLAPFTGRFFIDEFDLFLLATIAVIHIRQPKSAALFRLSSRTRWALLLFIISGIVATGIGVAALPAFDLNAFSSYYSPYNALRVAKGMVWGILLFPLLKSELNLDKAATFQRLALGMTLGVLFAASAVIWERITFTGLWNFDTVYRVVGSFSAMHTGGAYIEGYFATAIPFVIWWAATNKQWYLRVFALGVFTAGCYSMVVTFARGGQIGLVLAIVILVLGFLLQKTHLPKAKNVVSGLVLLMGMAGLSWFVLHETRMQERFSMSKTDLKIRTAHWRDALKMMDDSLVADLFGMGLGRYPETYFWRNNEGVKPATYRFSQEGEQSERNNYLQLSGGDSLYMEQLVAIQPRQTYHLSFLARSQSDHAVLTTPICEKWMLYSYNCIWNSQKIGSAGKEWKRFNFDFNTDQFATQSRFPRPIKLSLYNSEGKGVIDIDQVSLTQTGGSELIKNGNFDAGMDEWFFSTDNHLPWHFKNLWLQLYFEQGLIGLCLFVALLLLLGKNLLQRYREKNFPSALLASAITGFLTVGVVDSLFDSPRMAVLFYCLVICVLLQPSTSKT